MKNMSKKVGKAIYLAIMTLVGFGLRVLECLWGYPYLLHPDEEYIVERTADMVNRSSWEANVFEWPGHLLIKLNSIVFNRICWWRYNDIVADTYEDHRIFYYMAARLMTCLFGAAMIVLAYFIAEKIKEGMGKWAALIFTFYPVFIKHSGYATTDIPLSALFMLTMLISMLYIEKPDDRKFYFICFLVGASMCTKYPGTVFVAFPIYIAFREGILKKDAMFILKKAVQAAITIFLSIMLLAPNLVTNFDQVLIHVAGEADYEIIGAVNYGFAGNILFYLDNMAARAGVVVLFFAAIGIIWCIVNKKPVTKLLVVAFLYMIFISALNLQLERWGMPAFSALLMLAVAGIAAVYEFIRKNESVYKYAKWVLNVVVLLVLVNVITGGARQTLSAVVKENRVRALAYCEENGITDENAYSDGYSPFNMDVFNKIKVPLDDEGHLVIKEGQKKQYYILSAQNFERFFKEPVSEESKQVQVRYNAIWEKCKLVTKWEEFDRNSYLASLNTYYNIDEIIRFIKGGPSGTSIYIYEKP